MKACLVSQMVFIDSSNIDTDEEIAYNLIRSPRYASRMITTFFDRRDLVRAQRSICQTGSKC